MIQKITQELKIPLFANKKEILIFAVLLITIFMVNIFLEYIKYYDFSTKKFYKTQATVINCRDQPNKNGKLYKILKLKSDEGFIFHTTTWKIKDDITGKKIDLLIITKDISFLDFLSGFYAPTGKIEVQDKEVNFQTQLSNQIKDQHENQISKELFSALFLATPLSQETRNKVIFLGASHIVAISGFHAGILGTAIFFLFSPIYRFFQNKYFPYRNLKFDIGIFVLIVLFGYLILIDYAPSFLRSCAMALFGFYFYTRGVKVISFETLFVASATSVALFPSLLFSVSFWLSIAGVFYIFLVLEHFGNLNKILLFLFLNIAVFLLMVPIIHFLFPQFSIFQLTSIPLTIAFEIFFPLELFLHLIGFGGILDFSIESLLKVTPIFQEIKTPLPIFLTYITMSIGAIYKKYLFFALFLFIPPIFIFSF